MPGTVYLLVLLVNLAPGLAAPSNITTVNGDITFTATDNVYLTQNFQPQPGRSHCPANQTMPYLNGIDLANPNVTQQIVSSVVGSLSEAQKVCDLKLVKQLQERDNICNGTMRTLYKRLTTMEEKLDTETQELRRKLYEQSDHLGNMTDKLGHLEQRIEDKTSHDRSVELGQKLDELIGLVSNISERRNPRLDCMTNGLCLFPNGSYPQDCADVYRLRGHTTSVYKIKPAGAPRPVDVYCDMSGPTKWTVFMSRYDGSVSFNRTWAFYKAGFGDVSKEHWLGLDTMHYLTNQSHYKVRFEMRDWRTKETKWAEFSTFTIGPESSNYRLSISGESGTASRGRMNYHNGQSFSTKDNDNDSDSRNCAEHWVGGWWFNNCYYAFFTGPYTNRCATTKDHKCMVWVHNTPLDRVIGKISRV